MASIFIFLNIQHATDFFSIVSDMHYNAMHHPSNIKEYIVDTDEMQITEVV